jgi:integrase
MEVYPEAVMQLENTTVRDYLLVLLFTGLRLTEAMKLKWANVDLKKAKTLTVPASDTKTKKEHCLPLSDFLVELLKARHEQIQLSSPYVFPGEVSTEHMVEPKRKIAQVIKNSGVKFSPHTLRRTFETTAESLDVSYYALKRLLNHSMSSDITSRYIVTRADRLKQPMH